MAICMTFYFSKTTPKICIPHQSIHSDSLQISCIYDISAPIGCPNYDKAFWMMRQIIVLNKYWNFHVGMHYFLFSLVWYILKKSLRCNYLKSHILRKVKSTKMELQATGKKFRFYKGFILHCTIWLLMISFFSYKRIPSKVSFIFEDFTAWFTQLHNFFIMLFRSCNNDSLKFAWVYTELSIELML